jgi:hypothetical protein
MAIQGRVDHAGQAWQPQPHACWPELQAHSASQETVITGASMAAPAL